MKAIQLILIFAAISCAFGQGIAKCGGFTLSLSEGVLSTDQFGNPLSTHNVTISNSGAQGPNVGFKGFFQVLTVDGSILEFSSLGGFTEYKQASVESSNYAFLTTFPAIATISVNQPLTLNVISFGSAIKLGDSFLCSQ